MSVLLKYRKINDFDPGVVFTTDGDCSWPADHAFMLLL